VTDQRKLNPKFHPNRNSSFLPISLEEDDDDDDDDDDEEEDEKYVKIDYFCTPTTSVGMNVECSFLSHFQAVDTVINDQ